MARSASAGFTACNRSTASGSRRDIAAPAASVLRLTRFQEDLDRIEIAGGQCALMSAQLQERELTLSRRRRARSAGVPLQRVDRPAMFPGAPLQLFPSLHIFRVHRAILRVVAGGIC